MPLWSEKKNNQPFPQHEFLLYQCLGYWLMKYLRIKYLSETAIMTRAEHFLSLHDEALWTLSSNLLAEHSLVLLKMLVRR